MKLNAEWSKSRAWVFWWVFCIVGLLLTVSNLRLWPKISQDEVQILDHGRVAFDLATDWGMSWLLSHSQALAGTAYIGATLQEIAYQIFSNSNFGPRISTFIGGILASSVLLAWLRQRDTPPIAALVCALIFLADPLFNESYRQGRVDSWAFCFVFLSCWLIRLGARSIESETRLGERILFISGFVCALSPFVWPTAIALFPLVVYELSEALKGRSHQNRKLILRFVVTGGFAGLALAMLPLILNWRHFYSSFIEGLHIQRVASQLRWSILDMIMMNSPWTIPTIIAAISIRQKMGLLIAFGLTLSMMLQTMVYPMRILYLLPYFVLFVSEAAIGLSKNENIKWRGAILFCLCGLLFAWNLATSFVIRPLTAELQYQPRKPDVLFAGLSDVIGAGSFKIFLTEWDLYYASRSLGWDVYKVFGQYNRSSQQFLTFLHGMDYVIVRDKYQFIKEITPSQLENMGFEKIAELSFPKHERNDSAISAFLNLDKDEVIYENAIVFKNTSAPAN